MKAVLENIGIAVLSVFLFAGIVALQFIPLVGVVLLTLWVAGVWP